MRLCTSRMCTWSIYPCFISIFWLSNSKATAKDDTEYCELDVFQTSCAADEVILMKTAFYGRMALGRCIKQDFGYMGCKADVLNIMDGFCSGRQSCSVNANDRSLMSAKSAVCPTGVSGYLAPSYSCLKVQVATSSDCQNRGYSPISSKSGYISSNMPIEQSCPFKLIVSSGKKVNITMMNFPPPPSKSGVSSSACYEVGSIREGDKSKTIHKCLNDPRHKQLYLSNGGQVEIDMPHKESHDVAGHFLIHFEAGAGCPDPKIPKNAELQRTGNQASIKCTIGNLEWELECTGDTWKGDIGDCVTSSESGWSFLGLFDHEHPFGTAIVVGIGATLGVLIGGILLYIIIAIFKKCQKSDYVMTYEYTDPSFAHIPTDYHADKSNLLLQDDKLFEQNSNTWGSQRHGNSNTLSRGGGTDHSRVPLPPLPNDNNTLSYEKPLYNRNGNV